jgi:hypothetical protein
MTNLVTAVNEGRIGSDESAWLDPVDDSTMIRIQTRLDAVHCRFELREEEDGWVWESVGHKIQTRRVFDSAQLALEHADLYTRVWYPLLEEEPEELVRSA